MAKLETRREKWLKRWWIGTPTGGSKRVSLFMTGMDGEKREGMDGETIKPMEA